MDLPVETPGPTLEALAQLVNWPDLSSNGRLPLQGTEFSKNTFTDTASERRQRQELLGSESVKD